MKETFKYIGRWVIRFILMSIIFSTFQSCAKALSYEDIQYYVQETAIMYHNNPNYQYIKTVIDNSRSFFEPKDTTLANYRNVYIYREGATDNWLSMYVYYNLERVSASGMYMSGKWIWYRYNGSYWYANQSGSDFFTDPYYCYSRNTEAFNSLLGMNYTYNEVESIYTTPPTYVGNQGFYRLNELTFNNYLLNNKLNMNNKVFYYYKGDLYSNMSIPIGEIEPNDAYHYEIYLTENSTNTDIAYVWGDYSTGKLIKSTNDKMYVNGSNMIVLTTLYLKYNELYRVTITSYYGDYDNPTIKSIENLFIFLPNKTDISGDQIVTWVSGDNISNDTLQIIGNQNQNQEDNQSFLDNLYNQMFTVSGEQVQQIVNTTMSNVQIPSGEIAEIEQIFNYLSGDAGDFVISWTDKTTHFTVNGANISQMTIPARQINFSEMERQSPELQQAMHWARLITNISIFSILIHEAYICLLATLGVPVAIYGQKLEEKAQLQAQQQKQEQAWQNRLEQQRYNEWLYNHRKR